MRRVLKPNYTCVDIGCHKGEMLKLMLNYSPSGKHFAFEPIPSMFTDLKQKFGSKATIYPYALSDSNGTTTFQFVKNAPAYSGIKRRKYAVENPEIDEITVELRTLDEIIPVETPIHFMKIDVEGGEFGVMKGARKILQTHKPYLLFECGKGASEFYDTKPNELFQFLNEDCGLKVFTLHEFLKNAPALTVDQFNNHFETNKEYYFIAAKSN